MGTSVEALAWGHPVAGFARDVGHNAVYGSQNVLVIYPDEVTELYGRLALLEWQRNHRLPRNKITYARKLTDLGASGTYRVMVCQHKVELP